MNEIYMIRGRGNKFIQLLQIKTALLLGYKVKIITPQDTCRGRRANIISWIDDFPDFPKDAISPLDKPSKQ